MRLHALYIIRHSVDTVFGEVGCMAMRHIAQRGKPQLDPAGLWGSAAPKNRTPAMDLAGEKTPK